MDPTGSGPPTQTGAAAGRGVTAVLAVVLTCAAIAWAADLPREVGLLLYTEQYLCGMLAVALPLLYLTTRATRTRPAGKVPWYDSVAAAVGFAAAGYMAVRYPVLAELLAGLPADGFVAGLVVMLLVVEGLRRTAGTVLTVIVGGFVALALVGHLMPGALAGRQVGWDHLAYYLAWDPSAMLGTPMVVVTTIVTAYVFFGQVLLKSGGSAFFTEISMAIVGRFRGGQAKIAVIASGLFGSISGSAVSNVVTTGVITIPLMRGAGYRAVDAGAIEAVASTGGQLMPPIMGAAAFIMADFLQIPYTDVVIAALIPAILYYAALFIVADLEAGKRGIVRIPEAEIPRAWPVLKSGWIFPLPFAVLIGTLFFLNYSPELAALVSAAVILATGAIVGYRGKRLGWRDLLDALRSTGTAVLDIFMIGAAAGLVIGVLNISGLGFGLTLALVKLGGGNVFVLLLIAAAVCILLGMGMPTAGVYILLSTLVAPALVEVGFLPIAAHLFILYFGMMSMITPPVAIAAFAAASLSGADPMRTGFAAMRFGWLAYVIPFMFVFAPTLLMEGPPLAVMVAAVTATMGVWLVCVGVVGYLARPQAVLERILYVTAGIALVTPADAFPGALVTDVAGFVLGIVLVLREFFLRRVTWRS
ncbi:MAG TPA: TRAP transporter fused permease subunit [Burkholderiales bacterium]|nr:TRAP transporter fused permease subunit [Burkholderiales bacterium]